MSTREVAHNPKKVGETGDKLWNKYINDKIDSSTICSGCKINLSVLAILSWHVNCSPYHHIQYRPPCFTARLISEFMCTHVYNSAVNPSSHFYMEMWNNSSRPNAWPKIMIRASLFTAGLFACMCVTVPRITPPHIAVISFHHNMCNLLAIHLSKQKVDAYS